MSIPHVPGLEVALDEVRDALSPSVGDGLPSELSDKQKAFLFGQRKNALPVANIVFQGGGVLGIAHLGFLRGLEEAGIRAAGVAGTSAGAIVALLIAAARQDVSSPVAEELMPLLWSMPAKSFIDGPHRIRRLIKFLLRRGALVNAEMIVPIIASVRRVLRTYGLNTGNAFEGWLSSTLAREFSVSTYEDLGTRLHATYRDLSVRLSWNCAPSSAPDPIVPTQMLRVVATGLPQASVPTSLGLKFVFPRDLELFSSRHEHGSPASIARASMSVPLFFEPLVLDLDSAEWAKHVEDRFGEFFGDQVITDLSSATSVAFLDGGLLSNFPIDAFLYDDVGILQSLPTIGVTLSGQQRERQRPPKGSLSAFAHQLSVVVDGMRHVRDRDAMDLARLLGQGARDKENATKPLRSPVAIALLDVGSHNWLNFQLDESEMADLFVRGVVGAARFLRQLEQGGY
jgi:NTE family protein